MKKRIEANGITKDYPEICQKYYHMVSRCKNKNDVNYIFYGQVGVTICDEWLCDNGLINFYNWISSKYTHDQIVSLEIDKDIMSDRLNIYPAVYSPETCILITQSQNSRYAKKKKGFNTFIGVKKTKALNFIARVKEFNKEVNLGTYSTELEAAEAREFYISEHNTGHRLNNINFDKNKYNKIIDSSGLIKKKKYYGVSKTKSNTFVARLTFNKQALKLGIFKDEIEAARVINDFLIKNNHNLHKLNKIKDT